MQTPPTHPTSDGSQFVDIQEIAFTCVIIGEEDRRSVQVMKWVFYIWFKTAITTKCLFWPRQLLFTYFHRSVCIHAECILYNSSTTLTASTCLESWQNKMCFFQQQRDQTSWSSLVMVKKKKKDLYSNIWVLNQWQFVFLKHIYSVL